MTSSVPRIRIGRPPGGVVELALHSRAVTDPEDWLHVEVTVSAGAFSGSYFAYLRIAALREFRSRLAVLESDDLALRLGRNGRGTGMARDESGNTLTFEVVADRV